MNQLHVRHCGKVPIRGFNRIYAMALQALLGNPPSSFKDHRKAKNWYHSRYGEGWVEKLKSSTAMSNFFCITDLIRFMMDEAEKLMKGSVHGDDFYIVHDALVLMKAKETINWMKEKGYLHCWLLPLDGLQDGTPNPAVLLLIALSSCHYMIASIYTHFNPYFFIVF